VKEIVDIIQSASTTCNTKRMVLVSDRPKLSGFFFIYTVGRCYLVYEKYFRRVKENIFHHKVLGALV
jgi:hypothetical protein